ncbi:MAG: glutathione S-transferase family protein [Myxococcales bacterium]|nr:glutathione S-transferase family protein [Myxococcales bacterium]
MITLYYAPSTASLVVHWLLIELGVPHALHRLDLEARAHKAPAYLALNPAGVVPTLVVDDTPITEAVAIVMHLGDLHAEALHTPSPGTTARALYYQWLCFMANTLQPAYRAWFYPDEPAGAAHAEAAKTAARARVEAAWAQVAAHLEARGPWLVGANRTAADFMLTMLMRWSRNMPRPTHTWPALAAHATAMKALPSFRELYAREGLTEWT